jgi:hypothetical protein
MTIADCLRPATVVSAGVSLGCKESMPFRCDLSEVFAIP